MPKLKGQMQFWRKTYQDLLNWKQDFASDYAAILEGPRRVGKTTIAKNFATNEYAKSIFIDFSIAPKEIFACFDDISDLKTFFIRLQNITKTKLVENDSIIVFDEVQLFPKARQAIKHLVADGRYHYLETGSLISIRKNIQDILVPSEEMSISVHPMDYEEFQRALDFDIYPILKDLYTSKKQPGQQLNRSLLRDIRLYMAVGGMPQAVEAYINNNNFDAVENVKRQIIKLYDNDLMKIDGSGRLSDIYKSIPAQLARGGKSFSVALATNSRKLATDAERIFNLIDSKSVVPAYNCSNPQVSLSGTKNSGCFKLYSADTGLFLTQMFMERPSLRHEIYEKILSDKLPANLGYLYENLVAQIISSFDYDLYYHTWPKPESTHEYELDFLLPTGSKIIAFEVKSSGTGKHESIIKFKKKYSQHVKECYVLSQKDRHTEDGIKFLPFYFAPFLVEEL